VAHLTTFLTAFDELEDKIGVVANKFSRAIGMALRVPNQYVALQVMKLISRDCVLVKEEPVLHYFEAVYPIRRDLDAHEPATGFLPANDVGPVRRFCRGLLLTCHCS
jgi:hypothetical protein